VKIQLLIVLHVRLVKIDLTVFLPVDVNLVIMILIILLLTVKNVLSYVKNVNLLINVLLALLNIIE